MITYKLIQNVIRLYEVSESQSDTQMLPILINMFKPQTEEQYEYTGNMFCMLGEVVCHKRTVPDSPAIYFL